MVETLGEAANLGWRLHVKCAAGKQERMKGHECFHSAELDVPTLLWKCGRDYPLSRLGAYLRCPRCGSRFVRVVYSPPSERQRGAG